MTARVAFATTLASACALAACGKPQPPDREQPPEPQAAAPAAARNAINASVERAKQAEADLQNAQTTQHAAIAAATGE